MTGRRADPTANGAATNGAASRGGATLLDSGAGAAAADRSARTRGRSGPQVVRAPLPTRERRRGLAALAVLLIVGFAAAAGALVLRTGSRAEVLVVARPVPVGQPLAAADLRSAPVSAGAGVEAIAAGQAGSVVGRRAAVDLVAGQLLARGLLTDVVRPRPGETVVGVAVRSGQAPAEVPAPGARVRLVQVDGDVTSAPPARTTGSASAAGSGTPGSGAGAPAVLVGAAEVLGSRPDPSAAGTTLVSVLVPEAEAPALAAAAAAGQVALLELSRSGS